MTAEKKIKILRETLQFCLDNLECKAVHHRKSEYHESDQPCPVMARLERVMVETL